MYVMGGVYPSSSLISSFNFNCARFLILEPEECEGAAMAAVQALPPQVKLVFSGNHVGDQVWTGGCLSSSAGPDSPCRRAYEDSSQTLWGQYALSNNDVMLRCVKVVLN